MAKVTIIITDEEEGKNSVHIEMESDPPFDIKQESENTQAQICGIRFLQFLKEEAESSLTVEVE